MHHRFCQRLDNIDPLGIPNQLQTRSALQLPTDILDGPVATASKQLGKDNLLPGNFDLTIVAFGSDRLPSTDSCWLRATDGQCSVCIQGYNLFQGLCNKLPPACLKFSASGVQCLECDPWLTLSKGSCLDVNCAVGIFSRC